MTIMNCLSDNEMRNDQSVNSLILCCLFNAKIPYALDFLQNWWHNFTQLWLIAISNAINISVLYNYIVSKVIVLRYWGIFYTFQALPHKNKRFHLFFPIFDNTYDVYKLYVKGVTRQCRLFILLQNYKIYL